MMKIRALLGVALAAALLADVALAQTPDTFTARLSWVPISLSQHSDVGGHGSATAMLSGNRLSIKGTFEGLPAAATAARVHVGVATGAGGPAIADLSVTNAAEGTLEGAVELSRDQLASLLAGHVYIQLHAEHGVPPDNAVLRGWLFAVTPPRGRRRAERR